MTVRSRVIATTLAALAVVTTADAQTLGTPVFTAPYRAYGQSEFGVAFSDPGAGSAIEGHYRMALGTADLGFRVGVRDYTNSNSRLLLGVDWRQRMLDHSDDFPFDGALTLGAGLLTGDNSSLLLPAGFSMARRILIEDSEVQLTPYLHPVVALVIGGNGDVIFGVGFGIDVKVTRRLEVRVSGAMGDYDGVALGVAFLR
ncbi:MAG: hypothetical protein SGI84_11145 [Gemmatimonadota bacterium]|nr:hypothetical protein [Gemmatimonadota bacterium]